MNVDQNKEYKARIADLYSRRSINYDASMWHKQIARKLVNLSKIHSGANVLDIATGTGMVALYVATKVGSLGSVIGIDISEGMLEKAKSKAAEVANVSLELGDAEALRFSPDTFDYIFCGSAFIWMTNLHAALVDWRKLLKPTGKLGFHAFSENAFVAGVVAQSVLSKHGVTYLMNKPTGTTEQCKALLEQAGYRNIQVIVDAYITYISLDEAQNSWVDASHSAPGQFSHPLSSIPPERLALAKVEYDEELKKLNTEQGIANDMTTFYVFGEK